MQPGPAHPVLVTLTRGSGLHDERWTLHLSPDGAALVDPTSAIISEYTLPEAAAHIHLPGPAASSARIKIDVGDGRENFEVEGDGLQHLELWMRTAMAQADPRTRRGLLWAGLRDFGTGVLALGVGAALTIATSNGSNSPRYLFFGLILVGLVQIGRGALGAAEYRRVVRLAAHPAEVPAAVKLEEQRRSCLPAILLILALTVAILIFGLVIAHFSTPPMRNSRPAQTPAPNPPAPSVPPATAAPSTTEAPAAESPPSSPVSAPLLSGACQWARPPRSLAPGQFTSASVIRVIRERQNWLLQEPLACDAADPGEFNASFAGAQRTAIPAGSRTNIYLLHIDTPEPTVSHLEGQITFPSPILGLIASNPALDASDPVSAVRGTTYPTGGRWRQFFDGDSGDLLSISPDRRTLTIRSHTGRWIDQIRIITAHE